MKKYFFVFLFLPLFVKCQLLLPVKKSGKWGVIDSSGKLLVNYKYNCIQHFNEGFAYVELNNKIGFINSKGKEIIPLTTRNGPTNTYFKNGFCVYGKNGQAGFVNKNGIFRSVKNVDFVTDFHEGLAAFGADSKDTSCPIKLRYGFIDTTGNTVIEPKFKWATRFYEGLATVSIKGNDCNASSELHGFINKKGEWVIKPIYETATEFRNGYARVERNKKWGVINKEGKYIIQPKYDFVFDFHEGIAVFVQDKLEGLVDTTGKEIIPATYGFLTFFSEGYISFRKNGSADSVGFLDRKGNSVIPYASNGLCYFHEGLALIETGSKIQIGKYGFMNTGGKIVIPQIYEYGEQFENGFAPVMLKGKWGFINKEGRFVIEPQFDQVDKLKGVDNTKGLYRVLIYTPKTFKNNPYAIDSFTQQNSKVGYVWNGKVIWQPQE